MRVIVVMVGVWWIPHATWPERGASVCGEFLAKGNNAI